MSENQDLQEQYNQLDDQIAASLATLIHNPDLPEMVAKRRYIRYQLQGVESSYEQCFIFAKTFAYRGLKIIETFGDLYTIA
jgi:hypothetical protein